MGVQSPPAFPALKDAHQARVGNIYGVGVFEAARFFPAGPHLGEGGLANAGKIPRIRKSDIAFDYDHRRA